jgi:hypothetical protein
MDHHTDCGERAAPVLGTRGFLPIHDSQPALTAFIHEMMGSVSGSVGGNGHLADIAAGAAWQALSLIQKLGVDHEEVRVSGCMTDSHVLVELVDHVDFHQVLRDENELLLVNVNRDLEALVAEVDEVHFGRTADGLSNIQLAIRRDR